MKLLYVTIIICFLLISCEREAETFENEANYTRPIESTESQLNSNRDESFKGDITKGTTPNESEIFMNKMQWASYLSAKVIHNLNNTERSAVRTLISNEKIALEDLIGPNTQLPSFHNSFFGYLRLIFSEGNPGGDPNTPNKTEGVDPIQAAYDYLDYVLNQNCVELYFPVSILDGPKDFISLSHPLTISTVNYGYKRKANNQTLFIPRITSDEISSNQLNTTYIIARPARDMTEGSGCNYSQYTGINFTQFLQGPF
jgi:hypothetical protein